MTKTLWQDATRGNDVKRIFPMETEFLRLKAVVSASYAAAAYCNRSDQTLGHVAITTASDMRDMHSH